MPVRTASGRALGKLAEIHGAGGTDVWVIRGSEEDTYIPALSANLVRVAPGEVTIKLSRRIEGISQKMLTQTLRGLERDGLVVRTVHPEVPPRVEYELTRVGATLIEPLDALDAWAREHLPVIEAARAAYDESRTA